MAFQGSLPDALGDISVAPKQLTPLGGKQSQDDLAGRRHVERRARPDVVVHDEGLQDGLLFVRQVPGPFVEDLALFGQLESAVAGTSEGGAAQEPRGHAPTTGLRILPAVRHSSLKVLGLVLQIDVSENARHGASEAPEAGG
jgi:hypothetical protein